MGAGTTRPGITGGQESVKLTSQHIPRMNFGVNVNSGGKHSHSMESAGEHGHDFRYSSTQGRSSHDGNNRYRAPDFQIRYEHVSSTYGSKLGMSWSDTISQFTRNGVTD